MAHKYSRNVMYGNGNPVEPPVDPLGGRISRPLIKNLNRLEKSTRLFTSDTFTMGSKASGAKRHTTKSASRNDLKKPVTVTKQQEVSEIDDSYDSEDDPDFTLGNAEPESESDLTESEDELEPPQDVSGLKSMSQNSLEIVKRTHERFRTFVHEQEIPRKALHVSIAFMTLWLYTQGCETNQITGPLAIGGVIIYALDLLRFNSKPFNKAYCSAVGFMMREQETKEVNGVIWYMLGSFFPLYFCPKDVAVMSILLLSWGDTAASTFGRAFGRYTPKIARGKSLAGSIAAFIMGVISCVYFYGYLAPKYPQYNSEFLWTPETSYLTMPELSILCGFIAALSEGIDIYELDDNLTIPVLSGAFLWAAIALAKKPESAVAAAAVTAAVTAATTIASTVSSSVAVSSKA